MRQPRLLRSTTFHTALIVAAAFALFIIVLFGFIYGRVEHYLTVRSDAVITAHIDGLVGLSPELRRAAVDERLKQDPREVQIVAIFDADGRRITGNLNRVPPGLRIDGPAQSTVIPKDDPKDSKTRVVRAIARRMADGNILVVGRDVDEAKEISMVVGEAIALGLLPGFCLCLLAGAWLSMRADKRIADISERVQRIVAGELRERLPYGSDSEPFSKLAIIVNGMLDEMETLIHALEGVGNDIAHDLRTPLTRARLILERGRDHASSLEELQGAVDKAVAGIDQSLSIITALLRLAEIENSGRSAGFGEVVLGEMLREIFDMYEPIAEGKDITITTSSSHSLSVYGDRDLLMEALANLVDNAIKFTPEGGRVELALLRSGGNIILRVTDTGAGIAEAERESVLRRFYRSDKIRNTPGTGLGLSLVAAIVKLHGFRLFIYSGPGGRIEIHCPVKLSRHDRQQARSGSEPDVRLMLDRAS
nr:ATP-binding protein [Bradyrhizobium sp. Tv2a-2]